MPPIFTNVPVHSQENERPCMYLLEPIKNCLTLSIFIETSVPSPESEQSYNCVLNVSILTLYEYFLLNFGTVPTVCHFIFDCVTFHLSVP
jgi:hypothetical protein